MAANEKVLDSADVFDSWEDLDEADVLERKLRDMLPQPQDDLPGANSTSNSLVVGSNSCNKSSLNMILLGDDALRTQYVPPEPTVKILKRPTGGSQTLLNGDCKPRQQFKTLKQREQEYAEARLRILGESSTHNLSKEERICAIQNKNLNQSVPSVRSEPAPLNALDMQVTRLPRGPDGTRGFNIRR